ncbi:FkbM family methyltransferase [Tropicimonas sediminicola]|uniref:Methyltransferase, FkbM family n=1 Tax=Tropicimonas sediminicola TaxID=1031541 RepID=A0A239CI35_9RHOB|nr:FkbM family methyltransferase [Tropicimonas sediminicola]SNS19609.1 methyltransferase, FkbM family [Tropicimonas sediminicola]
MVIPALLQQNSLPTRLRRQRIEAAGKAANPKPWQRLARLELLAETDAEAAIAGLEQELEDSPAKPGILQALLRLQVERGDAAGIDAICDQLEAAGVASNGPIWIGRFLEAWKGGRIAMDGVTLAVPRTAVEPRVLRGLAGGSYESHEVAMARHALRPGDRVLELGAGLGYVACATLSGQQGIQWRSAEANPRLIPVIEQNRALNGVSFDLEHAAYGVTDGPVQLALSHHGFWAASLLDEGDAGSVEVPGVDGARAIAAYAPSFLIMDIEGAEYDILARLDLAGIERLLVEFHPSLVDKATHTAILGRLISEGFVIDTDCGMGQVLLFDRSA